LLTSIQRVYQGSKGHCQRKILKTTKRIDSRKESKQTPGHLLHIKIFNQQDFKNALTKAESLLEDFSFFGDSDLSLFFRKLLNGDCRVEMKDK